MHPEPRSFPFPVFLSMIHFSFFPRDVCKVVRLRPRSHFPFFHFPNHSFFFMSVYVCACFLSLTPFFSETPRPLSSDPFPSRLLLPRQDFSPPLSLLLATLLFEAFIGGGIWQEISPPGPQRLWLCFFLFCLSGLSFFLAYKPFLCFLAYVVQHVSFFFSFLRSFFFYPRTYSRPFLFIFCF